MIYEKAFRPPPAGSLREALFLTVWLRRQEIEFHKTRALFTAINLSTAQDRQPVIDAYRDFFDSIFPFAAGFRQESEQNRKQMLEKVTKMGPIQFSVMPESPLERTAKQMQLPDEFRKNLTRNRKKL